jgi:hypothetical protein
MLSDRQQKAVHGGIQRKVGRPPVCEEQKLIPRRLQIPRVSLTGVHSVLVQLISSRSPPADPSARANTPASAQASRLLLLAMFALASRYIEQPASMPNNQMWESGCNFAIDAREVLSELTLYSARYIYIC